MSDDDRARIRERERGHQASQILSNPLWAEAWSALEANLRAHMEEPSAPDEAVLEARRGLIVAKAIQRQIQTVMETGRLAEEQMERSRDARDSSTRRRT